MGYWISVGEAKCAMGTITIEPSEAGNFPMAQSLNRVSQLGILESDPHRWINKRQTIKAKDSGYARFSANITVVFTARDDGMRTAFPLLVL